MIQPALLALALSLVASAVTFAAAIITGNIDAEAMAIYPILAGLCIAALLMAWPLIAVVGLLVWGRLCNLYRITDSAISAMQERQREKLMEDHQKALDKHHLDNERARVASEQEAALHQAIATDPIAKMLYEQNQREEGKRKASIRSRNQMQSCGCTTAFLALFIAWGTGYWLLLLVSLACLVIYFASPDLRTQEEIAQDKATETQRNIVRLIVLLALVVGPILWIYLSR